LFLTTICFKFVVQVKHIEQNRLKLFVNIQNGFSKNKCIMNKNNKLEPYIQNKTIIERLDILQQKTPSLYNLVQMVIVGIGKPVMAARASFYQATGGFFTNSNIPWFKILLIGAAVYVLTYKNLNFNFNLNTPKAAITETTSMNVSNSLIPTAAFVLDDDANLIYIERFKKIAQTEMKRFGIPASVKMGQAILESQAGKTDLAKSLNNHFNLKCGVLAAGVCTETTNGMFKQFDSPWESWRAHSEYMTSGKFKTLLQSGENYKIWANNLKALHYNPDRQYAEKLIHVIEKYNLVSLDEI